jgi:glyoxylase-like metal-dependent hydrolase (beta-lactamase superfamily II)/rhodanese-related sulfurtransferase
MIFRQFFDSATSSFCYLLAARSGGEALIIDPVLDKVDRYIQLLDELDLKLVKAVDTHVHADHITGLGALRDRTRCVTVMGRESKVDVVSMRVGDGETIDIETISLKAIYTPGHTDDSYCFALSDRVFTGDALFIRGTGRTDFQHGDSHDAYRSLFTKLLTLPDETLVYPGHDYKGDTVSTIGEEKAHNPRLRVSSAEEYAEIMDNLGLANPRQMDVAVPANLAIGMDQTRPGAGGLMLSAADAVGQMGRPGLIFVDLREETERTKEGVIPSSVHAPYQQLADFVKPGGLLAAMAGQAGNELVLYCAYGERSALALDVLLEAGIANARHLGGGIDAWVNAGGALDR